MPPARLEVGAPGISPLVLHSSLVCDAPVPTLQAQQETQKAALRYERAVSMHNAAREMVFVAEQGVMADKNRLDPTWQEMLNHATCKVRTRVWGQEVIPVLGGAGRGAVPPFPPPPPPSAISAIRGGA